MYVSEALWYVPFTCINLRGQCPSGPRLKPLVVPLVVQTAVLSSVCHRLKLFMKQPQFHYYQQLWSPTERFSYKNSHQSWHCIPLGKRHIPCSLKIHHTFWNILQRGRNGGDIDPRRHDHQRIPLDESMIEQQLFKGADDFNYHTNTTWRMKIKGRCQYHHTDMINAVQLILCSKHKAISFAFKLS